MSFSCRIGEMLFVVFILASSSARAMDRGEFSGWWDEWRTKNDLKWPFYFCRRYPYYTNCAKYQPTMLKTRLPSQYVQKLTSASNPGILHIVSDPHMYNQHNANIVRHSSRWTQRLGLSKRRTLLGGPQGRI